MSSTTNKNSKNKKSGEIFSYTYNITDIYGQLVKDMSKYYSDFVLYLNSEQKLSKRENDKKFNENFKLTNNSKNFNENFKLTDNSCIFSNGREFKKKIYIYIYIYVSLFNFYFLFFYLLFIIGICDFKKFKIYAKDPKTINLKLILENNDNNKISIDNEEFDIEINECDKSQIKMYYKDIYYYCENPICFDDCPVSNGTAVCIKKEGVQINSKYINECKCVSGWIGDKCETKDYAYIRYFFF